MDVFKQPFPPQESSAPGSEDQRPHPAPDYGTLGPSSDVSSARGVGPSYAGRSLSRLLHVGAMVVGIAAALAVTSGGGVAAVWGKFSSASSLRKNSDASPVIASDIDLDRQKPQKQAEILLERAVVRSDGATDQIEAHVDAWRGKLRWDARLGELTTAALNSNDRSVKESAIEVQLAAYGLNKNGSTVDALVKQADSADHAKKIWALWGLGLLGNRGIETDRVVQTLSAHLKDSDRQPNTSEDSRRWAVEGLALVGTNATIAPLLGAMHDDPSPMVRERAACSLAESSMLSHDQKLIAVPQLIDYSADPALDAQTHNWAFQALGDITQQHLPNDSAAWRNWYQEHGANN
jgi:HEAT repeats